MDLRINLGQEMIVSDDCMDVIQISEVYSESMKENTLEGAYLYT